MQIISPEQLSPYKPEGMELLIFEVAQPILKKYNVTWRELLALTINPTTWRVPDKIIDVVIELIPASQFTRIPMLEYHVGMDGRMLHYLFHKEIRLKRKIISQA